MYIVIQSGSLNLIADGNNIVALEALEAVGNLAWGLRTHFSGSSLLLPVLFVGSAFVFQCAFMLIKWVMFLTVTCSIQVNALSGIILFQAFPLLITFKHLILLLFLQPTFSQEKYKEEEPVLTGALNQSLDAIREARCLSLTDIVEDIKMAASHEVPVVRSSTLNWVAFSIELSDRAIILKVRKDYAPIFMECLNDGIPEVREAAFFALGEMVKLVGFKVLESSLVGLDDERRHQLIEMIPGSKRGHEPQPSANLLVIPTELDEMLREALESVMARLQVEESEVNENVDEEDEDFEIREAELEDVPVMHFTCPLCLKRFATLYLTVRHRNSVHF